MFELHQNLYFVGQNVLLVAPCPFMCEKHINCFFLVVRLMLFDLTLRLGNATLRAVISILSPPGNVRRTMDVPKTSRCLLNI